MRQYRTCHNIAKISIAKFDRRCSIGVWSRDKALVEAAKASELS
jgi:hypothetical protein